MSENESRPVVVGVDGSAAAQEALRRAVEDARHRHSGNVVEGDPGTTLTDASEQAGLLVAGNRGAGPVAQPAPVP